MNCESVRELLSAFYDQELQPDQQVEVREHLAECADCARHLAEFKELSKLAGDLQQPQVPEGTWSAIDSLLGSRGHGRVGSAATAWLRRSSRAAIIAALAAGVLLAILLYRARIPDDEHIEMAHTFSRYLDEFHRTPGEAQRVLVERYQGRLLDLPAAISALRFEPNAPAELPNDFSRLGIYVLKMPCCTCTQTIYKDKSGQVLAVFEHTEDQRMWFGDRPTIKAQCHGQQTALVQLHNQLAATWKCGPRYLTVIGARNVEQVANLIAFLDRRNPASKTARGPT
jgi:hypothetical protein